MPHSPSAQTRHEAAALIQARLADRPDLDAGTLLTQRALVTSDGPFEGPEALVLLDCGAGLSPDYGHVLPHPHQPNRFVFACCTPVGRFDGANADLVLARYHHLVRIQNRYEPYPSRDGVLSYQETKSFNDAVSTLVAFIRIFDVWREERLPPLETPRHLFPETRLLDIYGVGNY
ncbi:hypothetical protein ACRYJU_04555 [Alloalcanivorax xenomutans]|uniref:Uncharacterized protein n=1 Tax=Alcanivorax xiamenensis TaxID=1177156 RepID=A0ABQ6Y595_9GAMM|nr:hypothetical protein [Alcanivorax xiamenensis]KAF0804404.1 hypothetical protein A6D6_03141 [Alcanivorax xiamenensis]